MFKNQLLKSSAQLLAKHNSLTPIFKASSSILACNYNHQTNTTSPNLPNVLSSQASHSHYDHANYQTHQALNIIKELNTIRHHNYQLTKQLNHLQDHIHGKDSQSVSSWM